MIETATRIRKGHDGWRAETQTDLGFEVEGKPAFLEVNTYKSNRGIVTYAGVKCRDGAFIVTRVFRDYSECLDQFQGRCTEKTIRERHALALVDLEAIKARAIAFHTAKGDIAPAPVEVAAPVIPTTFDDATPPRETIWGSIQGDWERMAPGIYSGSTSGHGGFWITAQRLEAMPADLRALNFNGDCQWFEEDSDWCLVVRAFPGEFPKLLEAAEKDRLWRADYAERRAARVA